MLRGLALIVAIISVVPYAIDYAARVKYQVHTSGAVLITGSSSGIGKHACLELASMDQFTLFCGVRKAADADMLVKESGGKVRPVILDVTKDDLILEALKTIEESGEPLVGLINNAGVSPPFEAFEFASLEQSRWCFEINYFGVLRTTQVFIPLLRASKGRVITVSSLSGAIPGTIGYNAYAASKHAVGSAMDTLRKEVHEFGISVSVLEPAYVKSDIIAKSKKQIHERTVTPKMLELYPNMYGSTAIKTADMLESSASPTSVTTNDIVHALTDPYPSTRYLSAGVNGMPAWIIQRVCWFLPDRVWDAISIARGKMLAYKLK